MDTWYSAGMMPCGGMSTIIVNAWLVEAKQSVSENMAPVLTRLFTLLFTALLPAFLVTLVWSSSGIKVERDLLFGFNLLLVVVLTLLLYAISARDPHTSPSLFDALKLLTVVAALGENRILLVNLTWWVRLYARFQLRRGFFSALERWQTAIYPYIVYEPGLWPLCLSAVRLHLRPCTRDSPGKNQAIRCPFWSRFRKSLCLCKNLNGGWLQGPRVSLSRNESLFGHYVRLLGRVSVVDES